MSQIDYSTVLVKNKLEQLL